MESEFKNYPEIDRIYQHYKGGKYRIISLAKHSETGEDMVVYKSIPFGSVYVRPLDIWSEKINGRNRFQILMYEN